MAEDTLDGRRLYYRPLQPKDLAEVKAAHNYLFPIDYEDNFFRKAVAAEDRIFSFAAFVASVHGHEELVGFVTARHISLTECERLDRHYMGLVGPQFDGAGAVYILTLGVVYGWQRRGIASNLISHTIQHALQLNCAVLFLHVIAYNVRAMSLYQRAGFKCLGILTSFYNITTGRTPFPNKTLYDAHLYALHLMQLPDSLGHPSPYSGLTFQGEMPWDGVLGAAVNPLRHMWGRMATCWANAPRLPGSYTGMLDIWSYWGYESPSSSDMPSTSTPQIIEPPPPPAPISKHQSHPHSSNSHGNGFPDSFTGDRFSKVGAETFTSSSHHDSANLHHDSAHHISGGFIKPPPPPTSISKHQSHADHSSSPGPEYGGGPSGSAGNVHMGDESRPLNSPIQCDGCRLGACQLHPHPDYRGVGVQGGSSAKYIHEGGYTQSHQGSTNWEHGTVLQWLFNPRVRMPPTGGY